MIKSEGVLNNFHKIKIAKNKRNIPSRRKGRESFPEISKKKIFDSSQKFKSALDNLKEGLAELSNESIPEDKPYNKNSYKDFPLNTITNTTPEYNYTRAKTAKKNISLNLNTLNSSKKLSSSYYSSNDFYEPKSQISSLRIKPNKRISSSYFNDEISKPEYLNDIISMEKIYNININNYSRQKDINLINKILKVQNKKLKIKNGEMRNKINELLNNLSLVRMNYQRIYNEKKELIMRISYLENELTIKKSMNNNEIELKDDLIDKLKDEILKLKLILEQKDKEIMNLNNMINIDDNNYINNTNGYDNGGQMFLNRKNNDIHELEYNADEENNINNNGNNNFNNDMMDENVNNLINQINILKNQLKGYESLKKYLKELETQKKEYEIQQNVYKQIIDKLNKQINNLKKENNSLKIQNKNKFEKAQSKQKPLGQNKIGDNNKMYDQFLSKIKQLLEENSKLKNQIKALENKKNAKNNTNETIKNNKNINHEKEINFLKSDLEEKNSELNDLNEKYKNLINQLNTSKNDKKDLEKNNQKLKEEIEQLNVKVSNLENENLNNQQQIFDLSNLNNKLQIRVNSVHSGNFKLNAFEQVQRLQQKNEELQEQLMYLNKENKNKINIAKIIEEKQNLSKENLDLKNELLILKNQINENVNENYLYNIDDNDVLENNKLKEMEKNLEDIKKKYEVNLDLLEKKENENQNLLSKIKNKENEYALLQKQLSNNTSNNEIKLMDSINLLNTAELNEEIEELKKEILEKNKQIKQLEDEINNIKILNNKLIQENNQIKEKKQIKENVDDLSDGGGSVIIANLREEIKEKNLEIEKLIKENNNLKNKDKKNNILDDEDEKEINKKDENIPIKTSLSNDKFNDDTKMKIYQEQIKELKMINKSDIIQIKTLKTDIKELKEKIKKMETFSGQLKNFDEFITLLNKVFEDFKPKKKEQKEAFNKLVNVMNNHHV